MEKKLIAAIAVVILIAAALMGSLVMLNQGDDNEPEQNYAGEVRIYGNANNDKTIDKQDVDTLKELITNGNYNTRGLPLC